MKKNVKSFALLAVAASALVSCKGELTTPEEKPQTGKFEYTFTLGAPETKAVLASDSEGYFAQWEAGDQLGIYTLNNELETTNNTAADIDISKNPVQFKVVTSYALDEGSDVYAYFPYDANNSTVAAEDPSAVVLSIPASQTGSLNAMPMAAKPYAVTEPISVGTKPIADIKMRNLGSILNFNVYSTNEAYRSETVSSIAFTASTPLCGSFTYDIMAAELSDITGYEGTTVTVTKNITPGNDKASGNTVPMVVAPNATAGYTGTIVVTTNVATYTYTISSGIKIDRSIIKKVNVDLGSANAVRQLNDQVYFIETFDGNEGTGGNDGQWSGSIASNTITADHYTTGDKWTFVSGGGASACIKLGAGSSLGSAQTPGLNADGTVKLTFKAAAWNTNNESTTLKLSCSNSTVKFYNASDEEITSVTMVKASWTTYTLTVKNLVNGDKIKFEGYKSSSSRFFLDNVAVFTGATPSFVIDPTAIAMSDETAEIVAGKTKKLTANFTPANTTNRTVTWASDDDDVATVEDGTVTAVGAGTATITATSEADPALVATCVVTVTAEPLVMSLVSCEPGKDYLEFSWTAVANAVGYKYSEDNETWSEMITETSHRLSGLADNTTKTLYVKAIGDGSRYGESDVKSASGTTSNLSIAQFNSGDFTKAEGGVGSSYVNSENSFTSSTGTWVYKNVSTQTQYLQVKSGAGYIKIDVDGDIQSVEIYGLRNGSGNAFKAGGHIYLKTGAQSGTDVATYTSPTSPSADATASLTISSGSYKVLYICPDETLRLNGVMVTYKTPSPMDGISISSSPAFTTMLYHVGDAFSTAGLEVTAHYEDNSTKVLTAADYTMSPANGTVFVAGDVSDSKTVTVTCGDFSANANIVVRQAWATTGISVKTKPTKMSYYLGESFNPAGMVLTVTESDGVDSRNHDVTSGYTYPATTFNTLTTEDNKESVTITYDGQSADVTDIVVTKRPGYTVTLGDEGTELETDGDGNVTLPTRTPTTDGHTFQGWSESNLSTASSSRPTIINAGTYHPTGNITLYPVYKYTVSEGSGSGSYDVTTTLTTGKKYIFGAVKANASSTLANNTTIGAVAFTNTYNASSPTWGARVDLTPDTSGKIASTDSKITDACVWTLESVSNGNYAFKNNDGKYLYLHTSAGSSSAANCGTNSTAQCYLNNASSTCKDSFSLHSTSQTANCTKLCYNTSNGYRMYASSRTHSNTMSIYFRFYEYSAGSVNVDYYIATK